MGLFKIYKVAGVYFLRDNLKDYKVWSFESLRKTVFQLINNRFKNPSFIKRLLDGGVPLSYQLLNDAGLTRYSIDLNIFKNEKIKDWLLEVLDLDELPILWDKETIGYRLKLKNDGFVLYETDSDPEYREEVKIGFDEKNPIEFKNILIFVLKLLEYIDREVYERDRIAEGRDY